MAALGDISTLIGSRPDWVAVIVELFFICNDVTFCVVLTLCKIVVTLYLQWFIVALISTLAIIMC